MVQKSYLETPLYLGALKLKNRVMMSALTRNRGLIPDSLNAEYYSQRASAGIIVSEGILIEPQGTEWSRAPGIWSKQQVEGWKKVVDKVHAKGGIIFAQLWHLGRCQNEILNCGVPIKAPSPIKAEQGKFRQLQDQPGYSVPEEIEDPKYYVEMFKQAAINAKEAGFDGVEFISSGGFLGAQFLESHSNKRTDKYGGSVENRARFSLEVIDALSEVYTKNRVGIKLSPAGGYNDMGEATAEKVYEIYGYLIQQLDAREIGYIQFFQYVQDLDFFNRATHIDINVLIKLIKKSKVFLNGGITSKFAEEAVETNLVDGISFGRLFISNPDLPERLFNNYELSEYNVKTFYPNLGPRELGYTDYKTYSKHN